jgi:hypothetical protein
MTQNNIFDLRDGDALVGSSSTIGFSRIVPAEPMFVSIA